MGAATEDESGGVGTTEGPGQMRGDLLQLSGQEGMVFWTRRAGAHLRQMYEVKPRGICQRPGCAGCGRRLGGAAPRFLPGAPGRVLVQFAAQGGLDEGQDWGSTRSI